MGGLCKAGVKRQTNRDENGGGECHCDMGDNYHGQKKKKTLARENTVSFDWLKMYP